MDGVVVPESKRRPRMMARLWDSIAELWGEINLRKRIGKFVSFNIPFMIANLVFSLISVGLLWAIYFRPYAVRPHVDGAALAAFDLQPVITNPAAGAGSGNGNATHSLLYDLTLNVTFFNDHRIFYIRFDHLTAGLYYNGIKLGSSDDTLPRFKLRTRRHRTVYPALRGRASNVGAAVAETFARERQQAQFNVDVRVKTTLTYKWWPDVSTYYYEYDCWLQFVPPPGNGTPAVTGGIKCGKGKGK